MATGTPTPGRLPVLELAVSVRSEGPAVTGKVVVDRIYSYASEQGLCVLCSL